MRCGLHYPERSCMTRRGFLALAGAFACAPLGAFAQTRVLRFADMHSHAGILRRIDSMRAAMEENGMLIVARKIVADGPVIRAFKGRLSAAREAQPGELAKN